jgi:hypothetical protein
MLVARRTGMFISVVNLSSTAVASTWRMLHSCNKYSIRARCRDRLYRYTLSDSYTVSMHRDEYSTPSCVDSSTEGTPFSTIAADSQSMKLYLA